MKRLFAILTICAATAATAGLGANPAAADGRSDSRQHRQERLSDRDYDRSGWRHYGGDQRHLARKRQRMHHKFRRQDRRHRHTFAYRLRNRQGHGLGHDNRHGYRPGPAYALRFDGARLMFRFD